MMESVVIALITAASSIVVAVIHATSAIKVARMKEQPIQQAAVEARFVSPIKTASSTHVWLWTGGILLVSALIWQLFIPWESTYIIHFASIPWATCLLAYFKPIRWGFVAGTVTLLNVLSMLTYSIMGAYYTEDDLFLLSIVFTINALLASGIAYWRSKGNDE